MKTQIFLLVSMFLLSPIAFCSSDDHSPQTVFEYQMPAPQAQPPGATAAIPGIIGGITQIVQAKKTQSSIALRIAEKKAEKKHQEELLKQQHEYDVQLENLRFQHEMELEKMRQKNKQ